MKLILLTSKDSKFDKKAKIPYERISKDLNIPRRKINIESKNGQELVKKYDHVVSSDLYYWLDYVDMKEKEFWSIADSFRDPRVWRKENSKWVKDNIWDNE